MKASINGTLHLSIGDGWWAEGYNGSNGWLIDGARAGDGDAQDAADAAALYALLEDEIVPAFYDRDDGQTPHTWVKLVKDAIRSITPQFSARRMVKQYVEQMYLPAVRHGATK
jgi:starch phosphorylase